MVTLLDCINRVPSIVEKIVAGRDENFAAFFGMLKPELEKISQIVLIGSGTSNTSAMTARGFMEKVMKLETVCVLPNEFLHQRSVYRPDALYIFTSQSGTSTLTQQAARRMREKGYRTVSITENSQTPLAQITHAHIDMGCGKEEYGMRTIGYCASVLTLMLLGVEIAACLQRITEGEKQQLIEHVLRVPDSHRKISAAAMDWFDQHREALMKSRSFTLYGGGSLWGVALEGALKILEISKSRMAVGYESDDGMHGPTMGFTEDNAVIVLDDGGVDHERGQNLARWAKEVMHNGWIIGSQTLDGQDLKVELVSEEFVCLEIAPAVQVLAYRLAVDNGIDLQDKSIHKEREYFSTHQQ